MPILLSHPPRSVSSLHCPARCHTEHLFFRHAHRRYVSSGRTDTTDRNSIQSRSDEQMNKRTGRALYPHQARRYIPSEIRNGWNVSVEVLGTTSFRPTCWGKHEPVRCQPRTVVPVAQTQMSCRRSAIQAEQASSQRRADWPANRGHASRDYAGEYRFGLRCGGIFKFSSGRGGAGSLAYGEPRCDHHWGEAPSIFLRLLSPTPPFFSLFKFPIDPSCPVFTPLSLDLFCTMIFLVTIVQLKINVNARIFVSFWFLATYKI